MSINSNHYRWVDLAKAASIFGVVFIHCGLFFDSLNVGYYFRFCVPLFIIISFFLAERLLIDRAASFSKKNSGKSGCPD